MFALFVFIRLVMFSLRDASEILTKPTPKSILQPPPLDHLSIPS